MSSESGSVIPVYGNHTGPDSEIITRIDSNNQKPFFGGALGAGSDTDDIRAFLRRRCKTMSGIKQAGASTRAHHCHASERPSGL